MRGRTSSVFFVGMSIIPLKKEPVKCKGLCALSAPSSLDTVMIICNFVVVSGENFLRIYNQVRTAYEAGQEADRQSGRTEETD